MTVTASQESRFFFFSSRRRHTRLTCDWSSDVCSSDLFTGDQAAMVAALTDISERSQALVREEIELAKAELTEKATKLAKGTAVGTAAGVFVGVALMFVLTGCAWLAWYELFPAQQYFWG